jgi:hypothetical protein
MGSVDRSMEEALYVSETYNPSYEDVSASAFLPSAANVRNFLNFPVMHTAVFMTVDWRV